MQIRVEAPPEVQEYIMKNESFSRSGDTYRGEGGDYITETENKHIKGHLSPGVPSIAHWIKASRNHEMLQRNRGSVFEKSSLKDPNLQESSIFRFDHEVQMLRCIIRDSGILAKPYDEIPLMALDRTYLHHDLVNFLFTARENYHKVLYNPDMEIKPVFVTYEDEKVYNDISTWKIEKIRRNIDAVLNELEDNDEYRNVYLRMKSANKQKLINFYEELKLTIKNSNAVSENEDHLVEKYQFIYFCKQGLFKNIHTPDSIYVLKLKNKNQRKRCAIFLMISIKTPEQC